MDRPCDRLAEGMGCEALFDSVDRTSWAKALGEFEDASIYQTWEYGKVRWGEDALTHMVLVRDGRPVAMAQGAVRKVPVTGWGIVYFPWGPVWRRGDEPADHAVLALAARAIHREYAVRRGLRVRVHPNMLQDSPQAEGAMGLWEEAGYRANPSPYRTIVLDLARPLEEVYRALTSEFRRRLRQAEKVGYAVVEGDGDDLYERLMEPYREMVSRKGFTPGVEIGQFREIQKALPGPLKMKILVCEAQGRPVSSLLISTIGEKGIFILGGTSREGITGSASYLLHWKAIQAMQAAGLRSCDLGGYNPDRNPNTALFKRAFNGKDVRHLGHFEARGSLPSDLVTRCGEWARASSWRVRRGFAAARRKVSQAGREGRE